MRFAGNSLLAVGSSLFGAAAAYQIYRNRAEANLSRLKRGSFSLPTAAQQVSSGPSAAAPSAQSDTATPADATAGGSGDTAATPPGDEPAVFAARTEATQAPGVQPGMLPVKLRVQSIGLNDAK